MSKTASVIVFLGILLFHHAQAQNLSGPCPTSNSTKQSVSLSSDLICLVPQVYGPGGLVGQDHGGPLNSTQQFSHAAHFQNSSLSSFSPLNSEIGTQLSILPLASPASGFVFAFNPSLGVVTRQTESFGPILTERAETIGRHRLFIGFSYQYFDFDKVDGIDMKHIGAVFHHEDEPNVCKTNPIFTGCSTTGRPIWQNDIIVTQNRVDLKVNQFTAVGTFGLTSRLDLSVAIPILDVHMSMFSDATIVSFETATDIPRCCLHQFHSPSPFPPSRETLFPEDPTFGFNHASFTSGNSATGIGDVILRGKFEALKQEKTGFAVGLDVRLPTGDAYNFLGSGTYGIRPFATFSYASRIAPHATVGFLYNGNSILAADITKGTATAKMPNLLTYSTGADVGITRRITASGDFLGQTILNASSVAQTTIPDFGGTPRVELSSPPPHDVTQASIAAGGKFNLFRDFLLTLNVLFPLINDAGLHSKPVPLVGLSYTF